MSKRTSKKTSPKPPAMTKRESVGTKVMEFADFGDRRVKKVELFSSSEHQSITIRFDDNTDLSFLIDAWFTFNFKTDYLISKGGNHRVLKRWPAVKSVGA
jgi:hypothetical protein